MKGAGVFRGDVCVHQRLAVRKGRERVCFGIIIMCMEDRQVCIDLCIIVTMLILD